MPITPDFRSSRKILDFRPDIQFVEPDQLDVEPPPRLPPPTIEESRQKMQSIISAYKEIEVLADVAQARIDQRAAGFEVSLDPKVDAHIIAAIKRCFPNKIDPTKITFDDYKSCIKDLSQRAQDVSPAPDTAQAVLDTTKVDFGGLGLPSGLNRPDLDQDSQIVPPLDLDAFQAAGIAALFLMLLPQLKTTILATPHVASMGTVQHAG